MKKFVAKYASFMLFSVASLLAVSENVIEKTWVGNQDAPRELFK